MKHLKLFESNYTVQSIKNITKEYHELLKYLKPMIMEKYEELANNDDYQPEMGASPSSYDTDDVSIVEIYESNEGVSFLLYAYDSDGNILDNIYINFTEKEIEECIIKIDALQYNL